MTPPQAAQTAIGGPLASRMRERTYIINVRVRTADMETHEVCDRIRYALHESDNAYLDILDIGIED